MKNVKYPITATFIDEITYDFMVSKQNEALKILDV